MKIRIVRIDVEQPLPLRLLFESREQYSYTRACRFRVRFLQIDVPFKPNLLLTMMWLIGRRREMRWWESGREQPALWNKLRQQ
jgi:hypothetical protein